MIPYITWIHDFLIQYIVYKIYRHRLLSIIFRQCINGDTPRGSILGGLTHVILIKKMKNQTSNMNKRDRDHYRAAPYQYDILLTSYKYFMMFMIWHVVILSNYNQLDIWLGLKILFLFIVPLISLRMYINDMNYPSNMLGNPTIKVAILSNDTLSSNLLPYVRFSKVMLAST